MRDGTGKDEDEEKEEEEKEGEEEEEESRPAEGDDLVLAELGAARSPRPRPS